MKKVIRGERKQDEDMEGEEQVYLHIAHAQLSFFVHVARVLYHMQCI